MPNHAWYLMLAAVSLTLFTFALHKRAKRPVVALYLFMGGLTYMVEFFVMVVFEAYAYYPEVLIDPYSDSTLGAIVSDGFVVPMIAAFVATHHLTAVWMLLISCAVMGVEWLSLTLGFYQHFWWKTAYTGLLLIVGLVIAQKWYALLSQRPSRLVRAVTLYFFTIFSDASATFLVGLTGAFRYQAGWFLNPGRDSTAFATVYIFILSLLVVLLIYRLKNRYWWTIGAALIYAANITLGKMGVLHFAPDWSPLGKTLLDCGIFLLLLALNNRLLNNRQT
ncbi:MAG: hypothetical protein P4N41_09585 [Negativicutes bacterium]|nr:hypothetical protein [Negativicutes bacterium]